MARIPAPNAVATVGRSAMTVAAVLVSAACSREMISPLAPTPLPSLSSPETTGVSATPSEVKTGVPDAAPADAGMATELTSAVAAAFSASTGLRTPYCVQAVKQLSSTSWATLRPLTGLDVKLFFSNLSNRPEVLFRNRYQSRINFSHNLYRYGVSPVPRTTDRTSLAASTAQNGPFGSGSYAAVRLGGPVCVVIDQIRFGSKDSGPYFNP